MIKQFNSSGPNIPAEHYTLQRAALIATGKTLVSERRYFTIFAPRQSGKSTYFQMLGAQLEQDGYKVCYTNFEFFRTQTEADFLKKLADTFFENCNIRVSAQSFAAFSMDIEKIKNEKIVLIVDEVEGINPEYLNSFLHTIRGFYHSRATHSLKSVILVGVQNITGVMEGAVSPFNINEELEVPYFTNEEILELLEMHETATAERGKPQVFSAKVRERICYMTAGQPGLVNGFAGSLVQLYPDAPVFEYEHYLEIEKKYLLRDINKNVSNIIAKAKIHRKFVERLLFNDSKYPFSIHDERIKMLKVNGVIKRDDNDFVVFSIPLYRKCLHAAFTAPLNGEAQEIRKNINTDAYFIDEKTLNIDKIIRDYQVYAKRRGFRYFLEKDANGKRVGLKEAALVYSFETYIQSFLQVIEGKSYLEPHVALGRSDLIVNIAGTEFVIEAKVFSDSTQYKKGKIQLAYYIKSLNLTTGVYLVFADTTVTNPVVLEADEIIDGIHITTYIVRYDVETDFSEPVKQ
jgi:AAA-like domain